MPSQMLKLDAKGPANVEVRWKWNFKELTVTVDGRELGKIGSKTELQQGKSFPLAEGGALEVKLTGGMQPALRITRDGEPLPGSATDPGTLAKTARSIVYFIAGLNLLVGFATLAFDIRALDELGMGASSIAFGLVFLFLALMVHLRGSWVALVVAIVFFSLDALATLGFAMAEGQGPGVGGIVFRVFLIAGMVRGVSALHQQKQLHKPDVGARGEGVGSPVAVPVRSVDEEH
jgi:hypothetical protein